MEQVRSFAGGARELRLPHVAAALVVAYACTVVVRPDGQAWDTVLDGVLRNAVWVPAILACRQAAVRVPRERSAWHALTVVLILNTVVNVGRVLIGPDAPASPPVLVLDTLALAAYLSLWVTLIALVRVRVPRFHPSMWLDGVITALGTTALGVAFLLGPYLSGRAGAPPLPLVQLALPATDLLLLALLVALGSILGLRLDRTAVLLTAALTCVLAGDVLLFAHMVRGEQVTGGPVELTWLTGMVLVTVAARLAAPTAVGRDDRRASRVRLGWRLLALPLAAIVGSLLVLATGWATDLPVLAAWLATATVVAALVRTAITFHEVRSFDEVRQEARTDELTGLPNRRALLEAADRVVAAASARRPAALLLLDLDGFKDVNDSLGHTAGDELLRGIGARLLPSLAPDELLARLGGDEFAVLLPSATLDEAYARAELLRALVLRPFPIEDFSLHVGVSIGVATAPIPAATVSELLRCADIAMYAAKSGRKGVHVYVPDPDGGSGDRLRTMEELRTALDGDELAVHLQPQVAFPDGRVVGAEALVRWHHPVRGLLSPAELLPAAEQAGLLRLLAERVLDLALDAAARWWEHRPVPVSVNLSAADVTDLELPGKVAAALRRHGLPAHALTLELVEDTLMADPDRGRSVLGELRRLGVRTSIDDYGTGYSSLAYLRYMPADELKLDRSLTADVAEDPRAAAIVEHTVALAHALGLRLVAEGVEDDRTAGVLDALGCDVAQGFGIARPMPVPDFLAWLAAPRPAPAGAASQRDR
ncbi:putative bifunctional diguanylate cyclase/phosphodiesterase [Blastococcus goldschmidtiae]|uniref:EAL domain-containing protein n=1 Tax=Blastococcus goldschmidtiae TaxID=3075546 RepID=A0ABU2K7X2_9ACTN|nr:EAL domain-containing protein [Blastococcus sp. DSM 46792]MDT0276287.1 EAL domain-containing protein [Blastococcus sp. DSM 46792]